MTSVSSPLRPPPGAVGSGQLPAEPPVADYRPYTWGAPQEAAAPVGTVAADCLTGTSYVNLFLLLAVGVGAHVGSMGASPGTGHLGAGIAPGGQDAPGHTVTAEAKDIPWAGRVLLGRSVAGRARPPRRRCGSSSDAGSRAATSHRPGGSRRGDGDNALRAAPHWHEERLPMSQAVSARKESGS